MPATFSVYKTFTAGETLTAADLNSSLSQFITNLGPEGIGDYSDTATQMRSTADPYPGGSESLATDLVGEINRLRYLVAQITGETYWYQDPDANIANIISGTTAVGLATQVTDGTNNIRTKIIDIGDWNMDTTFTAGVIHGLTFSSIRCVSAVIRNDANDTYYPVGVHRSIGADGDVYISHFGATSVTLISGNGGPFDSTNFDSTSYNRGWVTITYTV